MPPPIFRNIGDPQLHRIRRRINPHGLPRRKISPHPPASARTKRAPIPSAPPPPTPRSQESPRPATLKVDAPHAPIPGSQDPSSQDHFAQRHRLFRKNRRQFAPHHHANQLARVHLAHLPTFPRISHRAEPSPDRRSSPIPPSDAKCKSSPPPRSRSWRMTRNRFSTSRSRQRRRRLIQNQNLRLAPQRCGDLDKLLLRHRQLAHQRFSGNPRADPLQKPPRCFSPFSPTDNRNPPKIPVAVLYSPPPSNPGKSARLLIDGRDPQTAPIAGSFRSTTLPRICIDPASASTAPVIILMSVDFPAPFSPTSACTSPEFSSSDTPSSAHPTEALGNRGQL